ncbi:MAG: hypothetical protein HQL17_04755 [Candidatus Omnitrophica bacterium]|nr:hypothetical protein [Candidatus Omnitrophota bacterium]
MNKALLKDILGIIFVLLFSAAVTFYCQQSAIRDRYCVQGDVMQYQPAFCQYKGNPPPEDDFVARYTWAWNTSGTRLIYGTAAKFMDPVILTKVLPFILCALTALGCYLCAACLWSRSAGVFSAVLIVLYAWSTHAFSGGHPRAFAFPLLGGFFYLMLRRNLWLAAFITAVSVVFYPQVALITAAVLAAWAVNSVLERRHGTASTNMLWAILAMAAVAVMGGLLISILPADPFFGRMVSLEQMRHMLEFSGDGRTPFFVNNIERLWQDDVLAERLWGMKGQAPAGFLLIGLGAWGFYRSRCGSFQLDRVLYWGVISSLFWYVMSWLLMAHLFLPGRFLKFGIPVVLSLVAAVALAQATAFAQLRKRLLCRGIVLVAICIWVFPSLFPDVRCYDQKGLYAAMKGIPFGALTAGHPSVMDGVTVFTGKKVFLTEEVSLPFYSSHYAEVRRRTRDFFELYYATDIAVLKEICRRNNIRYVVVRAEHFTRSYLNGGRFYFAPYNDYVRALVKGHDSSDFVLFGARQKAGVSAGDGYFIVEIDRVR